METLPAGSKLDEMGNFAAFNVPVDGEGADELSMHNWELKV